MIHSDGEDVAAAIGMFTDSGAKHPPGLPEFKKLVADIGKQRRMQYDNQQREISGRQTPEIAEYYKMCIKRILKVKDGDMAFPWLAKVEDATDEQLNLIRDDLGKHGIHVHHFSEYAA